MSLLALRCSTGVAADLGVPEPKAKAAFLFSFPKYVEWPQGSFASPNDAIVICIVGASEIAQEIRMIGRNKTIGGRPVKVHDDVPSDVQKCHVLFIGTSQKAATPTLLRALQNNATLTIGDFDTFLDAGGMIAIVTKGTRIQFHVNLPPAQRAKLALNAKLLALAESVRGKSQR